MNNILSFYKANSTGLWRGKRLSFGLAFAPCPFPCELFYKPKNDDDPFEDDGAHCEDDPAD